MQQTTSEYVKELEEERDALILHVEAKDLEILELNKSLHDSSHWSDWLEEKLLFVLLDHKTCQDRLIRDRGNS